MANALFSASSSRATIMRGVVCDLKENSSLNYNFNYSRKYPGEFQFSVKMTASKFSNGSTNVVFIGVVIVLSLYVKGISCFRDSSGNKNTHNFRQLGNLEQSNFPQRPHSKRNEESSTQDWKIETPRIFFLTSPPYQIRLRQEERKAQTVSVPDSHFRYNDQHRPYADSPYKKKMSSSTSIPNELVSQMGGRGLDNERLTEIPKNARNKMFQQDSVSNSNPTSLFSNEIDIGQGSPLYTPLISAHALSNMGKFFEHLRQNLNAIQTEAENHASSEHFRAQEDVPHHQNHYTESHLIRKNLLGDTNKLSSKKLQLRATSMNSGAGAPKIRWHPPVTRFYYRDAKSPVAHPVRIIDPISSPSSESSVGSSRSEESHLLLERRLDPKTVDKSQSSKSKLYTDAIGIENGRSTVQTYNPSWSWTNLGLGKRAYVPRH